MLDMLQIQRLKKYNYVLKHFSSDFNWQRFSLTCCHRRNDRFLRINIGENRLDFFWKWKKPKHSKWQKKKRDLFRHRIDSNFESVSIFSIGEWQS